MAGEAGAGAGEGMETICMLRIRGAPELTIPRRLNLTSRAQNDADFAHLPSARVPPATGAPIYAAPIRR